jgi:hypothetical protein
MDWLMNNPVVRTCKQFQPNLSTICALSFACGHHEGESILPLPKETNENHENPSLSSEWDFNLGTLKCATGLLSTKLQQFSLTLWNGQPRVLLWCWFCHCFRHWKALQHSIWPINTTCRRMCGKGPNDEEMKTVTKNQAHFFVRNL